MFCCRCLSLGLSIWVKVIISYVSSNCLFLSLSQSNTPPNTYHYAAVNGEVSAELLRLPNQKLFDYLKRQYSQQSSKLNSEVFGRNSWEVVMAEV